MYPLASFTECFLFVRCQDPETCFETFKDICRSKNMIVEEYEPNYACIFSQEAKAQDIRERIYSPNSFCAFAEMYTYSNQAVCLCLTLHHCVCKRVYHTFVSSVIAQMRRMICV